jgi:GNAT superfamily N-acetyltransferase
MPIQIFANDTVVIRSLSATDFDTVVAIDAKGVGRRRDEFYRLKFHQALAETGIQASLAAEIDGAVVGFLLVRVFYGEFGRTEPVAIMDAFGVHPDFRRHGVGAALIGQLRTNLKGLGIRTLQTQVSWDRQDMLAFCHAQGFVPAPRFVLDLDLDHADNEEGLAP